MARPILILQAVKTCAGEKVGKYLNLITSAGTGRTSSLAHPTHALFLVKAPAAETIAHIRADLGRLRRRGRDRLGAIGPGALVVEKVSARLVSSCLVAGC